MMCMSTDYALSSQVQDQVQSTSRLIDSVQHYIQYWQPTRDGRADPAGLPGRCLGVLMYVYLYRSCCVPARYRVVLAPSAVRGPTLRRPSGAAGSQ